MLLRRFFIHCCVKEDLEGFVNGVPLERLVFLNGNILLSSMSFSPCLFLYTGYWKQPAQHILNTCLVAIDLARSNTYNRADNKGGGAVYNSVGRRGTCNKLEECQLLIHSFNQMPFSSPFYYISLCIFVIVFTI